MFKRKKNKFLFKDIKLKIYKMEELKTKINDLNVEIHNLEEQLKTVNDEELNTKLKHFKNLKRMKLYDLDALIKKNKKGKSVNQLNPNFKLRGKIDIEENKNKLEDIKNEIEEVKKKLLIEDNKELREHLKYLRTLKRSRQDNLYFSRKEKVMNDKKTVQNELKKQIKRKKAIDELKSQNKTEEEIKEELENKKKDEDKKKINYYNDNKDKINKKRREKINCPHCKKEMSKSSLSRHLKSKHNQ